MYDIIYKTSIYIITKVKELIFENKLYKIMDDINERILDIDPLLKEFIIEYDRIDKKKTLNDILSVITTKENIDMFLTITQYIYNSYIV